MSQEGAKPLEAQLPDATQFISAHPDSLPSHEKPNGPRSLPKTAILLGLGREHALSGQDLTKDHLQEVSAKKIDVEAVHQLSQELRTERFKRQEIIDANKAALDEYNIDPLYGKVTDVDIWTAITAYQLQKESGAVEYTQALADFGIKDFSDKDVLRQQVDAFWEKYLNIKGENHGDPDKFTDDFIRLHPNDAPQALDAVSPLLSAWGDARMIRDMIMLKAGVPVGNDESVLAHEVADTYHPQLLKVQKHLERVKDGSETEVRETIETTEVPVNGGGHEKGNDESPDEITTLIQDAEPIASPEAEKSTLTNEAWIAARIKEVLDRPENTELKDWYDQQLHLLPEMRAQDIPATGQEGWSTRLIEREVDGIKTTEVERIHGSHFDVVGRRFDFFNSDGFQIMKKVNRNIDGVAQEGEVTAGWEQPLLINNNPPENLRFRTPQGEVSLDVSGFVGLLIDSEGRVAVTLENEPAAQTPKKLLVRTPAQSSITKFQQLLAGDTSKDPVLGKVLQKLLPEGKTLADWIAEGQMEIQPLLLADANRIDARNITFSLPIDDTLRDELTAGGRIKMVSLEQLLSLAKAGLLNGHLASAILQNIPQN